MADEMRELDPTIRERMSSGVQRGLEGIGVDRYKARKHAQTLMGGESSNLPGGVGIADFVPFLGTTLAAEEGVHDLADAYGAAKRGDVVDAIASTAGAAVNLIPGAPGTIKAGKALVKKIKPMNLPKLQPIGTESVPKKQSLKEWAMAGGGVPESYKDRPDVWHKKVQHFAAGGEVYNTEPDMSDGGQLIDGPAFAGGGAVKKAVKDAVEGVVEGIKPMVDRLSMNFKDVTKRVPELTDAAQKLARGEMTASEFDKLVNQYKPVKPYEFVPKPASADEAMDALTESKRAQFGRTADIPAGERTELRLDIPAYTSKGVWVNSIHRPQTKQPTAYGSTSSARNVEMIIPEEKALNVAQGGAKAPFAVMRGEWNPMSEADAVARSQEFLNHPEWAQIGMDPERHSYFYDRRTMQPVRSAEEVIQIGPLVLAKKPKYGKKEEFKYADGGEAHMAKGGKVKDIVKGALTNAAEAAGMKAPVTANKDLTTLQDFHTSLGDKIRERAGDTQNMVESMPFKYDKGQRVFTEDSASKNKPPYTIMRRVPYGNQPMRGDHPTLGPGMGKVLKDPDTGKTMRTPIEPGYHVRHENGDEWSEFHIPESAIKGDVEMAKGGGAKKVVKDVVEEGIDVFRKLFGGADEAKEAGRIAFERQTPERLAREAEAAKKLAAMPPRSKAAVTEMGLYHPVGGGLKLSKPTWAMHATTVPDPQFKQPNIPIITPEQLVKEEAALFPLVGDRAAAGSYLTHVGANELERPVRLTGGPRYMDANYNPMNPEQSAAWESGLGRVTALGRQAMRAGEGGRPVYGIYTAGSGTNTDFNVMGANALLQQIPHSKISKKAEREFDRAMREGSKQFDPIPDWPGIRSPKAQEMLLDKSRGIVRTKLFDTMGKENFQSMGFPDVPATRKAIIEPELLDVPTNQAGYRLARMDPTGRIIESPNIPSDYPTAMAGQVAGKLDVPADYKDVFQSHFDARRLLGQPESGDYYSFSRAHPIQYANEEWLNRLMEQRFANERKIREGSYKKGGKVNEEGGALAKVKKQPKQQAQQHHTAQTNAPKQKLKGGLTLAKN